MSRQGLILTRRELNDGIYIDFEQRKNDESPAMIGVYEGNRYRCYVLDDRLTRVSYVKANGSRESVPFLEELLDRSMASGVYLFAFSEHEKNIMQKLLPHRLADIERQYINVNYIAKRFFNSSRKRVMRKLKAGKLVETNGFTSKIGLKDYLAYLGYGFPKVLSTDFKGAGTVLGIVRDQLATRKRFKHLTVLAQTQWKHLVTYNMQDCKGAKHLVRYVLSRSGGSVTV